MRVAKLPSLLVSSLAALAACSPDAPSLSTSGALQAAGDSLAGGNKRVTVMTRNLYLGADLLRATTAGSPQEFVVAVSTIWQIVRKNDFRLRAVAIADEIAQARPALVGLQEVYTWRKGPAGNLEVDTDYLAILLDELASRGLSYRPVASLQLFDMEAPTVFGYDVRATDHDVILASDLVAETRTVATQVYETLLSFPTPVGTIPVPRGFTVIEAKVRGEWIRFVNTHPEAYGPGVIRVAQAAELVDFLGGDLSTTILVGDLNSPPGTEFEGVLAAAGFQDLWAELLPDEPGLTDGFPEDLSLDGTLTRRVDFVLHRGLLAPLAVDIVGGTPADKAIVGLWPSDHAGVIGTLRILDERFAAQ